MTAVPPGVVRHLQIISDKHVDQLQAYKTIEEHAKSMTAVPPGVVRHLQIISDKHVDQL